MLRAITLQNFKSFGVRQSVPLEPITVLVGPNNSGKSNLLSVGRFVADCVVHGIDSVLQQETGGIENLLHRPPVGSPHVHIGWESDVGSYEVEFSFSAERVHTIAGGLRNADGHILEVEKQGGEPFSLINRLLQGAKQETEDIRAIGRPLLASRTIHLSLEALRQDAQFVIEPWLTSSGADLASVVALWRSAYPEKANQLDAFLGRCLPELKFVLARPSPRQGLQRLWVEQTNGQRFDAQHVSEGVLCFIAMAMHIIDAEPGTILFIEEPERSIHPQRLHELVELMRRAWHERQCQFVLSTHSRVLLDDFRDEPEAIVLFRRSDTLDQSTLVRRLADLPVLVEELGRAQPGEMLEAGVFFRDFNELQS